MLSCTSTLLTPTYNKMPVGFHVLLLHLLMEKMSIWDYNMIISSSLGLFVLIYNRMHIADNQPYSLYSRKISSLILLRAVVFFNESMTVL